MRKILDYLEVPMAMALVVGLGLMSQAAKAQQVDVQAGGTTVRVGPDQGGTDGAGTRVTAPGVDVRVGKPKESRREGRVIQIGPDRNNRTDRRGGHEGRVIETQPSYWIGIAGAEVSPELQAQLGLENGGVLVRDLVPNGPAAEGGIKKFDVILRANGKEITQMDDLVDVVAEEGERDAQITFEVMRAGRQETVWVQPAVKPAPPGELNQPGFREDPRQPGGNGWFFGNGEQPFRFRMFGPGVVAGGADGMNVQTKQVTINGTTVQVSNVNGVSKTLVTKDGETWEFDTDDKEARAKLPDDVRQVVDRVLSRGITVNGVDVNVDIEELLQGLPDVGGMLEGFRPGRPPQMQQRLRDLERQVEELQRRLGANPEAADNEAPGFNPDQVDTPTIEIPADDVEAAE